MHLCWQMIEVAVHLQCPNVVIVRLADYNVGF